MPEARGAGERVLARHCRTVDGEICIGLFAKEDIKCDSELTFDYNFERCERSAPTDSLNPSHFHRQCLRAQPRWSLSQALTHTSPRPSLPPLAQLRRRRHQVLLRHGQLQGVDRRHGRRRPARGERGQRERPRGRARAHPARIRRVRCAMRRGVAAFFPSTACQSSLPLPWRSRRNHLACATPLTDVSLSTPLAGLR